MRTHVLNSIEKTSSRLSPQALAVFGFTGDRIRHLLNNLGQHPGLNYLEIGVHAGSTFVAANYANKMNAVAIDDWSGVGLPIDANLVRQDFLNNTQQHLPGQTPLVLEQDCFTVHPDACKTLSNYSDLLAPRFAIGEFKDYEKHLKDFVDNYNYNYNRA